MDRMTDACENITFPCGRLLLLLLLFEEYLFTDACLAYCLSKRSLLTWSGYGILSNVVCLVIAGILLWWIVLVVDVAPPGVGCVKKLNALQRVDIYISLV